jgi:hypothetical protein
MATIPNKPIKDPTSIRALSLDEVNAVGGGQIFQALSSAISEVMKNFGGALNTAARGG